MFKSALQKRLVRAAIKFHYSASINLRVIPLILTSSCTYYLPVHKTQANVYDIVASNAKRMFIA